MNAKHTVLLSGGHLSPAFALYEQLAKDPTIKIIFVGRRKEFKTDTEESTELAVMKKEPNVIVEGISIPRFSLRSIGALISSFIHLVTIYQRHKPNVTVTFGGYVGFLVSIVSFLQFVPLIIHEQTHHLGKSNKWAALLAKKICVSYKETLKEAGKKGLYTGLPVKNLILNPPDHSTLLSKEDEKKQILYITGGTTGAVSLNDIIFPIVPILLDSFMIIHQTGRSSYEKAQAIQTSLGAEKKKRYIPLEYVDNTNVSWLMNNASLIISRSGANTAGEIGIIGTPAIFIPLPWSADNEQEINGLFLSSNGGAVVLPQNNLTSEVLLQQIQQLNQHIDSYKKKAQDFSQMYIRDGALRLAEEVLSTLRS